MRELKKCGNVFTSRFVGTGPSSYEKRNYRAAVLERLRNAGLERYTTRNCSVGSLFLLAQKHNRVQFRMWSMLHGLLRKRNSFETPMEGMETWSCRSQLLYSDMRFRPWSLVTHTNMTGLGVDGWIILGWISRRWDVCIWTGLGWPRIETGGGRL